MSDSPEDENKPNLNDKLYVAAIVILFGAILGIIYYIFFIRKSTMENGNNKIGNNKFG